MLISFTDLHTGGDDALTSVRVFSPFTQKPCMPTTHEPSEKLTGQIRQVRDLIYGNWKTCITYTFATLNLGDLLVQAPAPSRTLALATGCHPEAMARFLRCAASLGLVRWQAETHTYALSALGELLTSDHPYSQRAAAQLNGADYRYQPWGHLVEILQQGDSHGISPTFESGTLPYLAARPTELAVFHRAMTDLSIGDNQVLARAYPFDRFEHVMDIGGGEGTLLEAVLHAHPGLKGTLFDLADALQASNDDPALLGRIHRLAGDFFQGVPSGADLYIMKNVIHNWPEARALQLLRAVAAALATPPHNATSSRLLIIEYLVSEGPSIAALLDLNFMVLVDGRERTLDEYRQLGARAGLTLLHAHPTPIGRHILEFALTPAASAA